MTTQVQFASKSSGKLQGALAEPRGSGKAGGVVVVQEWHGINDAITALCDRFAQAGFVALAPDLYHGKLAKTTQEASAMMVALDKTQAVAEIGDAAS